LLFFPVLITFGFPNFRGLDFLSPYEEEFLKLCLLPGVLMVSFAFCEIYLRSGAAAVSDLIRPFMTYTFVIYGPAAGIAPLCISAWLLERIFWFSSSLIS